MARPPAEVGWALGDRQEHGNDPAWDASEAEALYQRLEQEVVPEFYARNQEGIPAAWVNRMRESMARLTPHFAADRTVREYTEQHYLPAASAYLERTASKGEKGKQIADLLRNLDQKWGSMHFGEVKFESVDQYNKIEAQIYFGDLIPDTLQLELFANGIDGESPQVQKMIRGAKIEGTDNAYYYNASVSSGRPATDYTPRVIPNLPGVSVPLETNLILWQH